MISCPEIWRDFFEKYYVSEISKEISKNGHAVNINVNVLETLVPYVEMKLYEDLISYPEITIKHACEGLKRSHNILGVSPSEVSVRFVNFPRTNRRLVKEVGAKYVGKFVSVVGIVRRVSPLQSFIKDIEFYCPECGMRSRAVVVDNKLKPEHERCYNDKIKLIPDTNKITRIPFRKIIIQDLPENLESNELPSMLEVWLFEDLASNVRAGDKIVVNGILKSMMWRVEKKEAEEHLYIEANSVEFLEKDFRTINITREDEEKIKALARDPDIYEKLSQSVAPSVYGFNDIKLAIALQLFGGCVDEDGRRGDIHVLIVGDPGVSKSKMLREVAKIAPRAVLSTGYSTTGAGLTVSAVKDEDGRWALEAGVLVLADKGIALIDEIEKMGKEDREHMLEALEQQTITVSKAGMHAVLNSRCAVLAAGNPKYGKFEKFAPLAEQIALESNLLSRFDLIFVVIDEPNEDRDREITRFLLGNMKKEAPIPPDLFRKYIVYVRENITKVEISEEAVREIEEFYVSLRRRAREGVTITLRQLEAIRRLTQAFAKIRLSNVATVEDARRAMKLLELSLSSWAIDPETGTLDISYGLTGIGAKTRDRIATLKSIIEALDTGNGAQLVEVLQKAEESGIPRDKAMQIISKLREHGDVFYPRHGLVKLVK